GAHASVLTQLVENSWEDSERLLFILALFLHPVQVEPAKAMPSTEISSIDAACDFAVFYFKGFFLLPIVTLIGFVMILTSGVPVTYSLEEIRDHYQS
ncbi:hypothetical protein JG688_00016296, partial [Phytophthora aleatoria]